MVGVNRETTPTPGRNACTKFCVTALDYRGCKTLELAGDWLARTSERVEGTLKGYEKGELIAAEVAGCYGFDL